MSDERSTHATHARDPHCAKYDWTYYEQLTPLITGSVLDVGCGAGLFIEHYSKKDEVRLVLGIDKYVDEVPKLDKVKTMTVVIPDHKLESEFTFDTVVSTEFIEHIEREKLEPTLEMIKGFMHKDSLFVGSTPNKISPTTNPYHLYEYTLSELLSIFKNYFSDVEMWDNGQNCTLWKAKI